MNNPYIHIKRRKVPLYGGYLAIVLTNDLHLLKTKVDPNFSRDYVYAHAIHLNYKSRETFCIVLNIDSDQKNISPGVVSHEALHITSFIADTRGFVADFNNDEPLAYLQGWVTDQVHKFIKEKGKKLK
ncbi:hypothetical protein [Wenyingzhuangia sp. 2_MG-2023]|uniref:hypothetical protein n=1 Tax=Wenyingzhuangia sp. 2_MG-2023 TaxID=3062639 RepID=UPI0026E279BE|nr:hypothetical protein [Wenyingzhuangia sp. 2_MG-2023]MDO6737078.1 hypothetical protein [Wenyingzhuangia sp. 2_MG-2023]